MVSWANYDMQISQSGCLRTYIATTKFGVFSPSPVPFCSSDGDEQLSGPHEPSTILSILLTNYRANIEDKLMLLEHRGRMRYDRILLIKPSSRYRKRWRILDICRFLFPCFCNNPSGVPRCFMISALNERSAESFQTCFSLDCSFNTTLTALRANCVHTYVHLTVSSPAPCSRSSRKSRDLPSINVVV